MDAEGFLAFVAAHRWRTAKSSPHSYSIKHWASDRHWFLEAVKHAHRHGEPGQWNGETFYYYRPGGGYRYWSYWNGDPAKLREIVAFNRARESGQLRLWD